MAPATPSIELSAKSFPSSLFKHSLHFSFLLNHGFPLRMLLLLQLSEMETVFFLKLSHAFRLRSGTDVLVLHGSLQTILPSSPYTLPVLNLSVSIYYYLLPLLAAIIC